MSDKPTSRSGLLNSYIENQVAFLQKQYPEVNSKHLYQFVKDQVNSKYKELKQRLVRARELGENLDTARPRSEMLLPTCQVVRSCSEGDDSHTHMYGELSFYETEDLINFTHEYNDKIISPSGSFYETTDKQISFIKTMNDSYKTRRKVTKGKMLKAKKAGDNISAARFNSQQASIKITMNSLPGGMGFAHSFLSSAANFSSVTSIGRSVVTNSYAHAERFLAGNFFFPDVEHAINFLVTCTEYNKHRNEIESICRSSGLYIPTTEEVYAFIMRNLNRYITTTSEPTIYKFIQNCSDGDRCFIFYMSNLHNLITFNDGLFKSWFDRIFDRSLVAEGEMASTEDIWKIDGDLLIVVNTLLKDELPVNKSGNTLTITDCLDNYELVKSFYLRALRMQKVIDELKDVFEVFTNHGIGVCYADQHKNMLREVVGTSDTDSILFTTKDWVLWYAKTLEPSTIVYATNAMIVYLLTKANEHILYHLSVSYNALDKDRKTIAMKNEFMMPVEMMTSMKKNYASLLAIQEGVYFGTPQLDIKGVALRGSNFSRETLVYTKWFIEKSLETIMQAKKLDAQECIQIVLNFERMVYDSLRNGETTFLTVTPVKAAAEYADAEKSVFFNYKLWEYVFAKKYGSITIPTKCFMVKLGDLTEKSYVDFLSSNHPEMLTKMQEFMKANPKKITRIPINPILDTVPEELRPIVATREIIYSNATPLYTILKSMSIVNGAGKKQTVLMSDIYGLTSSENGTKALQIINDFDK